MDKIIDIGTKINLSDLIESRMLIQANSGGGKSGIARVTMEETYGKMPFIVLDKKGEYYTLKEKFPDIIIIGGRSGDIAISMQAAPKLAKFIIAHRLTVIIDMSDLESDDQRSIFIRDFLKGMMNLGEDYWTHYLIFLEEAHLFCGQQDKMPSGKYVKLLMSEGRKMGYCGILITQRISKLHKDAAAECNNKFIGRTFLDLDINRSAAEMGLVGQDKFKLRDLKPQHFWAFGTSIEPHHVHEVVIKDAQTKFPKAGAKFDLSSKKPTEKIKQALAKLNELPQEAAKELKDLASLQQENTRLKKELAKLPVSKTVAGPAVNTSQSTSQITQPFKDEIAGLKIIIKAKDHLISKQRKAIQILEERSVTFYAQLIRIAENLTNSHGIDLNVEITEVAKTETNISKNEQKVRFTGIKSIVSVPRTTVSNDSDSSLSPGEKLILRACAQYPGGLARTQLTVLTGYARSTRNKYLQYLQQKSFISQDAERVFATESGVNALGNFEPLPQGLELQEYWLKSLPEGEAKILRVLIDRHPEFVDREDISNSTGFARSTRNKYLQYMAAKEIIEQNRDGVKASDNLFGI